MKNSDVIALEYALKQKGYSIEESSTMPYWRVLQTLEHIKAEDEKRNEESEKQHKASSNDYSKMYSGARNSFKAPSYKMPKFR